MLKSDWLSNELSSSEYIVLLYAYYYADSRTYYILYTILQKSIRIWYTSRSQLLNALSICICLVCNVRWNICHETSAIDNIIQVIVLSISDVTSLNLLLTLCNSHVNYCLIVSNYIELEISSTIYPITMTISFEVSWKDHKTFIYIPLLNLCS